MVIPVPRSRIHSLIFVLQLTMAISCNFPTQIFNDLSWVNPGLLLLKRMSQDVKFNDMNGGI